MKLVEYQGKELFKRVGIPVPRGEHATSAEDVAAFIAANPGSWVLKAQVQMGGRGKAGGIKFADNADEGKNVAKALIGTTLRGIQNPEGEQVKSLLVEEKVAIAHEAYASITIDRSAKKPVFIVTARGGMDIEEVADKHPDAISKFWVDPAIGYQAFEARRLFFAAKLPAGFGKEWPHIAGAMYRLFFEYGANLVEINPLVLTKDGRVIASDAKVDLDDNALYKHPELAAWEKENASPDNEDEAKAVAIGLGRSNYARLDGDIGVMANGAGLGMGTMDAIRNAGGHAANFLDVGGGAQAERVRNCYALIVSDPKVKAMFINIFGGITRADQVASGIVEALSGDSLRKVPLVVRLTGTNEKEGREILSRAGIASVETMDDGAAKAVALAKGAA
ncbi:MAG: ADP-forming succinate--CoA ligase subunit beta [Candidatus Eremiobacteraeota bacterium]|nr:ADP-forming succinate--CoA ligase subunit beta [Candidatus Eremiobacteraeota bacterium]